MKPAWCENYKCSLISCGETHSRKRKLSSLSVFVLHVCLSFPLCLCLPPPAHSFSLSSAPSLLYLLSGIYATVFICFGGCGVGWKCLLIIVAHHKKIKASPETQIKWKSLLCIHSCSGRNNYTLVYVVSSRSHVFFSAICPSLFCFSK